MVKTQCGILLAGLAFAFSSALAAGRSHDVRVLRSTEQSIQIEFTPNYLPVKAISFQDKEFVEYDFEGSAQLAKTKEAGVPDLRYKLLPLGFQSIEGNIVQIIAADFEEIPNMLLKPMPTLAVKNEMLVVKDYAINTERYSQNQFLPGKVADLSSVEQSRSMLIGGVKLYPIQYNPATKTLRRYSRIVVEVVFATSSAPRVQNDDDALFGGMLLNANEAKGWKSGKPQPLNRINGQPSVLANGNWYRLTVNDEGMYILDANWFSSSGISLSNIDPRTIKIYGNGGEELSENVSTVRPVDLVENAIYVEGEADGQFNSGDYLLFYGKGIQGIKYDPVGKTLRHYIHHYSRSNFYWLTFGGVPGKRMTTQQSAASAPAVIPTKFMDAVWVEPDTVNLVKSGKSWLGLPMNSGGVQVRTFPLNGLILSEPRTYRFTLVAGAANGSYYNVRETGTLIGTYPISGVGVGGYTVANDITAEASGTFPIQNNTSQLSFEFRSDDVGATGWLDWVEVIYQRTFDPVNNSLRFRSPDTTAVAEYRLGQFSGAAFVFNVTNQFNVRRVAATSGVFRAAEQAGAISEYFALGANAYRVPAGAASVPAQNLRGITQQYDFLIVTSQEFSAAANRLKEHRQTPAYGGLKTIVVDVNQIYNEFSCGVPDVTAIRDFLKYAYENWMPLTPPKFVCFFGQASYDYKGILGSKSSYVPTWQRTENPYDDVFSSSSDDFFVRFTNGAAPFMISGRLNARSTREADRLVDKIIGYDTRSTRDGWKTRALFVGDDGWVRGENLEGNIHTEGAEDIANLTPGIFEKKKVYLEEYPTVIAQGRTKPGAYQDIIDFINRGVLIVNFTGHGNPTVWTHEGVFSTQTSIPSLFNADKLAYFFAATCNFSQFDDPNRESGSELLMNRVEGGAIGFVSASRKVFSNSNEALNRGIYVNMFGRDQFGRVRVERVATALFAYKAGGGSFDVINDEKYFVLGDPTLRLQFPQSYASIDSINGASVDFVDGVPRTSPIQLRSLARIAVKGSIRSEANTVDSTFRGKVTLEVNDATRNVVIAVFNWPYSVVGAIIYRGENSVSNGRFTATFVVPKDIAYADSTTRGRLVAYYTSAADTRDGAGFTNKVTVSGSDPTAPVDTAGPSMKIYLGNTYGSSVSFRSGDVVNEKPTLFVDLVDSNGINTSTSGVGHRIEAWINNSGQSKDLTEFYTSRLDNFQAGTVQYPLRNLPQGRNTIRVRAWDTYNNARTAETYFEVMSSEQLRVVDVMNYPNPFTKGTAFTFRHNQAIPVNATIKVYTIAGRLIQTLEKFFANDTFVSVAWDGRDRDGDELANGVYLYKLLVRTVDGRFSSEVLGKLAIAK